MDEILQQLLDIWRTVYRYKVLALVISVVVSTLLVVGGYALPNRYRADSTVFIETSVINNLVQGIAITPDPQSKIRVLKYAMLSRNMIEQVVKKLDPAVLPADANVASLVRSLINRTEINVSRNDLFSVSIEDTNPQFARDYINTLVSTYVEENLSQNRIEASGANRFLGEQIALFKEKLDRAEDEIIRFRRENGIYVAGDEKQMLDEVRRLEDDIERLGIDVDSMTAQKRELEAQIRKTPKTISIFSESATGGRVAALQARLQQLLQVYTENYPEVIRLRAELEALKKSGGAKDAPASGMYSVNPVYQDLNQTKSKLDAELSALQSKRESLRRIVENRKQNLRNIPESKKQLALMTQELDSLRTIYNELLARAGKAEVSRQMEIGNKATTFRVVDRAILPTAPSSPNRVRLILMALVAGLGVGVGGVFLLDLFKGNIRRPDDLQLDGLQIIGMIPHVNDPATQQREHRVNRRLLLVGGSYYVGAVALLAMEILR